MDPVELEYERKIVAALQRNEQETAIDLAQGLKQYQELYQIPPRLVKPHDPGSRGAWR